MKRMMMTMAIEPTSPFLLLFQMTKGQLRWEGRRRSPVPPPLAREPQDMLQILPKGASAI